MRKFLLIFTAFLFQNLHADHYVNKSVVSMHCEPNSMSEVISQAIYATPVNILQESGKWIKIQTPDQYQGWVKSKAIFYSDHSYPKTKNIARVNGLWTHVFHVNDTTPYPPLMTIPYGTKIEVISPKEQFHHRWIRVRLLCGRECWAQSADLDLTNHILSLDEMIEESQKLLGIPYYWGGNSSFGYDCSGFIQTLFLQMGIQLPRDAYLQARYTADVSHLKKGDLVFFDLKEHVTHVGLYIGENVFIHSVTTNKHGPHMVQKSRLSDAEWSARFAFARRVISLN